MDIKRQLEATVQNDHLVSIMFYTDWSPHYEWVRPVPRTYKRGVIGLINVNIKENKAVTDSHNIDTVPAFLLLYKGHELWRQVGELAAGELKEVLGDS